MNHDYAHCADMTDKCPKGCFRAQLTRDLKAGMVVSFMHMKNTDECPLTKKDRVMEIVIKLTEDDFKKVQDGRAPVTVMRNAIRNGKPLPEQESVLDKIRAEIKEERDTYDKWEDDDYYYSYNQCLDIIDKYIEADKEKQG